jgi:hypothetical protein
MYEIPLTRQIYIAAYKKARKLGALKNSIMKGGGNFTGYIGEYAVKFFLNQPFDFETYDYDMVFDGITYDIKSKKTTVIPKMSYDASVCEKNITQKCDNYLFVRVYWPNTSELPLKIFMMGYYPSKKYIQEAKIWKKGELDPSNGYIVKEDCRNMFYNQVHDIAKLIERRNILCKNIEESTLLKV